MRWDDTHTQTYISLYGEHRSNDIAVECANLFPDDHLLDIGCGTGRALRLAAKAGVTSLVGCDPSEEMVLVSKHHCRKAGGPQPLILRARGEELPLSAGWADCVIASNTHAFWSEPNRVLREIWRVLRPSGRLVLLEDDWNSNQESIDFDPDTQLVRPCFADMMAQNGFPERHISLERRYGVRAAVAVVTRRG